MSAATQSGSMKATPFIMPVEGRAPDAFTSSSANDIPLNWGALAWEIVEKQVVPIVIEGDSADGFTATSPVIDGCIAEGDTVEEAFDDFKRGYAALIEEYKKAGLAVPLKPIDRLPIGKGSLVMMLVAD